MNIQKFIEPFFNSDGSLNRENSITIEVDEYVSEPRKKPCESSLFELKQQKKRILENKKEFYPTNSLEFEIGKIAVKTLRGKNRIDQINKIVFLLKQIQLERNYTGVSRDFIFNILNDYTNLTLTKKYNLLNKIIKFGKVKEKVKSKKVLVGIYHEEKRLSGEITKSKNKPVNKEYVERNNLIKMYDFSDIPNNYMLIRKNNSVYIIEKDN